MLVFAVTPDSVELLNTLAAAFWAIVAPGAPWYDVKHYKHACPRVAASLERLAGVLAGAWSGGGEAAE